MEKRVVVAALLSAVFLSWYAHLMGKWTGRTKTAQSAPAHPSPTAISDRPVAIPDLLLDEEVVSIESEHLIVEIGKESADVRQVLLKTFHAEDGSLVRFGGRTAPVIRAQALNEPIVWILKNPGQSIVQFSGMVGEFEKYDISYQLDADNPLLHIILQTKMPKENTIFIIGTSWNKADMLDDRSNPLEHIVLSQISNGKNSYKRVVGQLRNEKHVPRGTRLTLTERYFCLSLKPASGTMDVTFLQSKNSSVSAAASLPSGVEKTSLTAYVGPRDYFRMREAGAEDAIPVGAVGKLGLILLSFLSFLGNITKNYGVAIILFSALIMVATGPFTLMSARSMKKMQELKPKIDQIMAQRKGDTAKANQEVFALYHEHRVSPLSGCLPMLLQFPIFIALFQAISHYIELRGARFLWIKDLSLPDRAGILPFSLPVLGNELNALPVIMAVAMFLQTRMSQKGMPTDQSNPAAKIMSGPFMAIMFGIMFYHVQSGLVLYWLTNSLMSILLYRLVK